MTMQISCNSCKWWLRPARFLAGDISKIQAALWENRLVDGDQFDVLCHECRSQKKEAPHLPTDKIVNLIRWKGGDYPEERVAPDESNCVDNQVLTDMLTGATFPLNEDAGILYRRPGDIRNHNNNNLNRNEVRGRNYVRDLRNNIVGTIDNNGMGDVTMGGTGPIPMELDRQDAQLATNAQIMEYLVEVGDNKTQDDFIYDLEEHDFLNNHALINNFRNGPHTHPQLDGHPHRDGDTMSEESFGHLLSDNEGDSPRNQEHHAVGFSSDDEEEEDSLTTSSDREIDSDYDDEDEEEGDTGATFPWEQLAPAETANEEETGGSGETQNTTLN